MESSRDFTVTNLAQRTRTTSNYSLDCPRATYDSERIHHQQMHFQPVPLNYDPESLSLENAL